MDIKKWELSIDKDPDLLSEKWKERAAQATRWEAKLEGFIDVGVEVYEKLCSEIACNSTEVKIVLPKRWWEYIIPVRRIILLGDVKVEAADEILWIGDEAMLDFDLTQNKGGEVKSTREFCWWWKK